jgi:hypothetical protein
MVLNVEKQKGISLASTQRRFLSRHSDRIERGAFFLKLHVFVYGRISPPTRARGVTGDKES